MVIAYRASPVTIFLARRLLKVRFACLLNLWMDREVVPEFLQEACRADRLVPALASLLTDGAPRSRQLSGLKEALLRLGQADENPSRQAARQILRFLPSAEIGSR